MRWILSGDVSIAEYTSRSNDIMEKLKEHMWLLDFCGFYKGEDENPFQRELQQKRGRDVSDNDTLRLNVSSMLWFYEECWVRFTINWECGFSYFREYLHDGLEDFLKDSGTPISLKALLHNRYFHWSGGYETVENFKKWYLENYERYRDRSRWESLSEGKRILDEYRLEFLMYKADWQDMERTPQMDYRFDLVDCVDALHSYESTIDEETMCQALEYAARNNCRIEIVPDEGCENRVDGWTYHIEYRNEGLE